LQCLKEFIDFTYIKTPAAVAYLQELKIPVSWCMQCNGKFSKEWTTQPISLQSLKIYCDPTTGSLRNGTE
jgi:hypothetical protein